MGRGGNAVMTSVWYWFRVTFARRWQSYLSVAVLLGVLGGVAMGSVAGARRTSSAFHRFLVAGHPSDMTVDNGYNPEFLAFLSHLPEVRSAKTYVAFTAAAITGD